MKDIRTTAYAPKDEWAAALSHFFTLLPLGLVLLPLIQTLGPFALSSSAACPPPPHRQQQHTSSGADVQQEAHISPRHAKSSAQGSVVTQW